VVLRESWTVAQDSGTRSRPIVLPPRSILLHYCASWCVMCDPHARRCTRERPRDRRSACTSEPFPHASRSFVDAPHMNMGPRVTLGQRHVEVRRTGERSAARG
jgi:hypothetical protein